MLVTPAYPRGISFGAKAGIQIRENLTGFRVKPGMTVFE
jgi:hypothetical protein